MSHLEEPHPCGVMAWVGSSGGRRGQYLERETYYIKIYMKNPTQRDPVGKGSLVEGAGVVFGK
jgi:hypothetical protein